MKVKLLPKIFKWFPFSFIIAYILIFLNQRALLRNQHVGGTWLSFISLIFLNQRALLRNQHVGGT